MRTASLWVLLVILAALIAPPFTEPLNWAIDMAIALFVNGVKGKSALELGRDLDCPTRPPSSWRTSCARRWAPIRPRASPRAMSRSTAPTSAATSSRRTLRRTGATAGWPRTRPASAASWSSCASGTAGRCPFVVKAEAEARRHRSSAGSRRARPSTPTRRPLGRAARRFRDEPHQPQRGVLDGRRLHQSGRELLLPPAPGRVRPAPPHQRRRTSSSTPGRWRGARTIGAGTTAPCSSWPASRR